MKRSVQIGLKIYLTGVAITAALLLWHGLENGGLQRSHDLSDLMVLALAYAAFSALWPLLLIQLVLYLFGIGPIQIFFGFSTHATTFAT